MVASNSAGSSPAGQIQFQVGEIVFNNMIADPNLPHAAFPGRWRLEFRRRLWRRERPRAQVDLTLGRDLWSGLRLKFKAENLLNAEYRWEQEANGITQIQRSYHTGRTFAITVSYGR